MNSEDKNQRIVLKCIHCNQTYGSQAMLNKCSSLYHVFMEPPVPIEKREVDPIETFGYVTYTSIPFTPFVREWGERYYHARIEPVPEEASVEKDLQFLKELAITAVEFENDRIKE